MKCYRSIEFSIPIVTRVRIESANEPFKLEVLKNLKNRPDISIYHIGSQWWDLCAGPHVTTTKEVPAAAIDLLSVAGAYWKGDETKPMLQVYLSNCVFQFVVNVCVSVANLWNSLVIEGSISRL